MSTQLIRLLFPCREVTISLHRNNIPRTQQVLARCEHQLMSIALEVKFREPIFPGHTMWQMGRITFYSRLCLQVNNIYIQQACTGKSAILATLILRDRTLSRCTPPMVLHLQSMIPDMMHRLIDPFKRHGPHRTLLHRRRHKIHIQYKMPSHQCDQICNL